MSDEIDMAEDHIEKSMANALLRVRGAAALVDTTNPDGRCLSCGTRIGVTRRWCDKDCRDDYERNK